MYFWIAGCGKTHLCIEFLKAAEQLYDDPPRKILYCYGIYQPRFDTLEEEITWHCIRVYPTKVTLMT